MVNRYLSIQKSNLGKGGAVVHRLLRRACLATGVVALSFLFQNAASAVTPSSPWPVIGDNTPPGAVTVNISGPSGAYWRIIGDNTLSWRSPGNQLGGLKPGTIKIEFKAVVGFITPSILDAVIVSNQLTTVNQVYQPTPPPVASLTVNISPSTGQWRLNSSNAWLSSGQALTNLAIDGQLKTIIFKEIDGYKTPVNRNLVLAQGVNSISANYEKAAPHLTEVYVPGRTYTRCKQGSIQLACGFGVNRKTLIYPITADINYAAIIEECKNILRTSIQNANPPITDPWYIKHYNEMLNSNRPDFGTTVVAQRETISPLTTGSTQSQVYLDFMTETVIGDGPVTDDDSEGDYANFDACSQDAKKQYNRLYDRINTGSLLVENETNSNFNNPASPQLGVVKVDQTLLQYRMTPLTTGEADYMNENRVCYSPTGTNVPWVYNVRRDITSQVSLEGQPIRNPSCNFITVLAPGTKLFDIGRKATINGKSAIVEGKIAVANSNISVDQRPAQLDFENPFFEIRLPDSDISLR